MRCPTLIELPPPPAGETGWPWTIETPPLPPARPDGSPWPRISIVTPSYNQGQFIEETIRSVLLQGYPDLEYVIIDGGSTDQSVEIIRKYEPWLTHWVSEKDRGQAHAINKGLGRSSGHIFQWINSDDVLLLGAMSRVANAFCGHAVAARIVSGEKRENTVLRDNVNLDIVNILYGQAIFSQPAFWIPTNKLKNIQIAEDIHYAFDWDMLIRYLDKYPEITYLKSQLVFFRFHKDSKSIRQLSMFAKEGHIIRARLSHSLTSASHRSICRNVQHKINWERHLTEWQKHSREMRFHAGRRMILLGFREPRVRINRFWFSTIRRTLIS